MAPRASSAAISPRRARTAAKAGARPASPPAAGGAAAFISGGPGERGRREARPALALDAQRVDARARGTRDRQLGPGRVKDARQAGGLAGLHAERDHVFD